MLYKNVNNSVILAFLQECKQQCYTRLSTKSLNYSVIIAFLRRFQPLFISIIQRSLKKNIIDVCPPVSAKSVELSPVDRQKNLHRVAAFQTETEEQDQLESMFSTFYVDNYKYTCKTSKVIN